MKVVSKLANVDFHIGRVERQGERLVIFSDPDKSMPSKVYVMPEDVLRMLKAMFATPSSWLFLLLFPYYYLRARRSVKAGKKAP
jgi:hypothetical protein